MSSYRAIYTTLWHDPATRSLPRDAKLLFLYLITSPASHMSGIYYCPKRYIEADTGLDSDEISTALEALSGLVEYDNATEIVWIVNMAKHQAHGRSDNWKCIRKHVATLSGVLPKKFDEKYPEGTLRVPSGRHQMLSLTEQNRGKEYPKKGILSRLNINKHRATGRRFAAPSVALTQDNFRESFNGKWQDVEAALKGCATLDNTQEPEIIRRLLRYKPKVIAKAAIKLLTRSEPAKGKAVSAWLNLCEECTRGNRHSKA